MTRTGGVEGLMSVTVDELIAPTPGTRFKKLRDAQAHVLSAYSQTGHTLRDIAIELPTGAGKSLIALLILEFWRKRGKRVAVLTGNKTLAKQIEIEARDLNVPTVRFEGRGDLIPPKDLRAYHRANAIAVMNYWVYINQNPAPKPADYVVLDDAQLAESALSSLFSVSISPSHDPLFDQLMRIIAEVSDSPVARDYARGQEKGPFAPTDLLPFTSVARAWDDLATAINTQLAEHKDETSDWKDLRFRWDRIYSNGNRALLLVNGQELVIRPYIYPTQHFAHLEEPSQRIYMSATIHDPDDLRRRLGTAPIKKLAVPLDLVDQENGRKLLVFNQTAAQSSDGMPGEQVLAPLREILRKKVRKSVWLCSSSFEALRWQKWLIEQFPPSRPPTTWQLAPMGDELEEFRSAEEGHLFIAGRFEGMDFPDDACRLAVFPSLPRATGALERFLSEQLKDASFQRLRMLERIKQGIGRCNRGPKDFAVYYFLDPRFYIEMESKEFQGLIDNRTRKQIEFGLGITEDGFGSVVPLTSDFLEGNFTAFDKGEKQAEPFGAQAVAKKRAGEDDLVGHEVEGWLALFASRDLAKAVKSFESVSKGLQDAEREHRGFWKYLEAHAEFHRSESDKEADSKAICMAHLERAIKEGGSASWFNRLQRALNDLKGSQTDPAHSETYSQVFDRWDELAEKYPHYKGRFAKWQAAIRTQLEGTHPQACEALCTLGHTLGFNATRPEGNGVPDGVWVASDHVITIEVKREVTREGVILKDVNQADGHRRWAEKQFQLEPDKILPIIVTPLDEIHSAARASLGSVRIVAVELITDLQARLEGIMKKYWKGWSREDATARAKLRQSAASSLPPLGWLFRVLERSKQPFLSEEELFKQWPPS